MLAGVRDDRQLEYIHSSSRATCVQDMAHEQEPLPLGQSVQDAYRHHHRMYYITPPLVNSEDFRSPLSQTVHENPSR